MVSDHYKRIFFVRVFWKNDLKPVIPTLPERPNIFGAVHKMIVIPVDFGLSTTLTGKKHYVTIDYKSYLSHEMKNSHAL